MKSFLGSRGPVAIAHRGNHKLGENTMRAFRDAVDKGYRHIETDVRVSADGVLVVFHDRCLQRTTNARGPIERMTWEELRAVQVAGSEPLVRFDELLHELPNTRFSVDPKSRSAVAPLAQAIDQAGAHDRVCVGSFFDNRPRDVRARCAAANPASPVTIGAGTATIVRAVLAGVAGQAPDFDVLQVPDTAGPIPVVTKRLVSTAHEWGLFVHVWTVNKQRRMEELLDMGVDGIMTDEIDLLASVFAQRGLDLG